MRIACIPARGEGSRVRELRADGNKLLLEVGDRSVLDRQLELLDGFDLVVVLTLPKHAEALQRAIAERGYAVRVQVIAEGPREADGPMLSLRLAIDRLRVLASPLADVSFLFSDTLFLPRTPMARLTEPGTVIVSPVGNGARFVTVDVDDEGWACRWHDHPASPAAALATVGLYTLSLAEWDRILHDAEERPNDYGCFSLASWRAVRTDAWLDVGTVESYQATAQRLGSRS